MNGNTRRVVFVAVAFAVVFGMATGFAAAQSANFTVEGLDAPEAAPHGANIEVTATINNTGNATGNQTILYNTTAGNDQGGAVNITEASQTVTNLPANNTTEVSFTVDTSTLNASDSGATVYYTHGIFSENDSQTAPLRVGSSSNGRVTVTVQDDALNPVNDTNVEILRSSDFTTVGAVNDADILANGTPNNNGEIQFTDLTVGGNQSVAEEYTVIAARQDPDFASSTSQAELFETSQTEDAVTITVDRLATPEQFDITQSADFALADGEDTITFNVSILDDLDGDRMVNEPFTVFHDGQGVNITNGTGYTTDGNGFVEFDVSSTETEIVDFTFVADNNESVTETRTKTFALAGEGTVAGTVYDVDRSGSGLSDRAIEDANVWAVQRSSFLANANPVEVPAAGDEYFYRLVEAPEENVTATSVDYDREDISILDVTQDYRIDNDGQNDNLSISRVRELNVTDAAVGSGWAVESNAAADDMFVTPLEPPAEDYTYVLERSDWAPNASDDRFATDPANPSENFGAVNVSGADIDDVNVPNDVTLSSAQMLSDISGQQLWDNTDGQGDYVLDDLFANFQSGVEYVLIANNVGYEIEFVDALVTESGAFFEDGEDENFALRQVEVDPNFVDVTQVGTHPPLEETGGVPDTDQITEFDDQTDDTFQRVSRDGTVDVIQVDTGIEGEDGQVTPEEANVTVDFNDNIGTPTGDAQFVETALGGDVLNVGDQSITINTGDDGEATVLFETDQSGTTVDTQKVATLETDTSVFDESNVTFVGVATLESASISGMVTDSEDTPLPGSPVWAQQFTVEDPDAVGPNDQPNIIRILPDTQEAPNTPEFVEAVNDEEDVFDVTLQEWNMTAEEYEVINSDSTTAQNLQEYEFTAFPSISAQDTFKLFQFASEDGATYSLEPTPALAESGPDPDTDYRIRSVRIEGADENLGIQSNDALVSVQPDTTGTANVVIPITVDDDPTDPTSPETPEGLSGDNADELWSAVIAQDGDSSSFSLSDLGSAISAYQADPGNATIGGESISLQQLGDLISIYQDDFA